MCGYITLRNFFQPQFAMNRKFLQIEITPYFDYKFFQMASQTGNIVIFCDKLPTVLDCILALLDGRKQIRINADSSQTRVSMVAKAILEIFERYKREREFYYFF